MPTLDVPKLPGAAPVALRAAETSLVVCDMSDVLCAAVPDCARTVPTVRALVDRARAAGVPVVFSLGRSPQRLLPEMGRREGEPIVRAGADKFFRTTLEADLGGRRHVVLAGTSSNGSIVYTALGCCARGMTVVVAEDTISSKRPLAAWVARWQLLNQPGYPNEDNRPLRAEAVTLSRSDLIAFA